MPHHRTEEKIDALPQVIKSFIFVTVRGDAFSSGTSKFLSVLGIDEESGRLRDANRFSFILAGVVYCTRTLRSRQHYRQPSEINRTKMSSRLSDGAIYKPGITHLDLTFFFSLSEEEQSIAFIKKS